MNDKDKMTVKSVRRALKIPSYHNIIINKKAIRESATKFIMRRKSDG